MDDALGYGGDDFLWDGLACPPLEEAAFNFDETGYKLDGILDVPLLDDEEEDEQHSTATNATTQCFTKGNELKPRVLKIKKYHCYGNHGKGKELKLNLDMEEINAFLEEETEQVVEKKDEKIKFIHSYDCQSTHLQQKIYMYWSSTSLAWPKQKIPLL